jgi:AraC-like DNA-binding protein
MKINSREFFSNFIETCDVSVSFDGFVVTDETWRRTPPIPSPSSRIYYVIDGEGMLISDSSSIKLKPGYVYIAPSGIRCGYFGTPSVTKLFFHINVILPDGYDLFSTAKDFARIERPIEYMQKLTDWYLGDSAIEHVMLKAELWQTVSEFSKILLFDDKRPAKYSPAVSVAISHIRNNLSASLTVADVSEAVFCSPGTLSAAFKRELGLSVAKYIEDLLMFEARRMLLASDRSISNISSDLGFCDQFYFSRRFKKQFGLSPREYRKVYLSSIGFYN